VSSFEESGRTSGRIEKREAGNQHETIGKSSSAGDFNLDSPNGTFLDACSAKIGSRSSSVCMKEVFVQKLTRLSTSEVPGLAKENSEKVKDS